MDGPTHISKYAVVQRLGTGGMAEVFQCRLSGIGGFDKVMVVKRILPHLVQDEAFVAMFLDEARIAANLTHPNVVQVFEIAQDDDGTPFIAMEYVRGPTLSQLLRAAARAGQLHIGRMVKLLIGAAQGLDCAHQARGPDGQPLNIVHRDISPQNILVSFDGVPKVLDFGVAKADGRQAQPQGAAFKGKVRFMAPELILDPHGEFDRRADIFSLGVCLYVCTTGRLPFSGDTDVHIMQAIARGVYPWPSEVVPGFPQELEEIIAWALATNREQRCPTGQALAERLEAWLARQGETISDRDIAAWLAGLFPDAVSGPWTGSSSASGLLSHGTPVSRGGAIATGPQLSASAAASPGRTPGGPRRGMPAEGSTAPAVSEAVSSGAAASGTGGASSLGVSGGAAGAAPPVGAPSGGEAAPFSGAVASGAAALPGASSVSNTASGAATASAALHGASSTHGSPTGAVAPAAVSNGAVSTHGSPAGAATSSAALHGASPIAGSSAGTEASAAVSRGASSIHGSPSGAATSSAASQGAPSTHGSPARAEASAAASDSVSSISGSPSVAATSSAASHGAPSISVPSSGGVASAAVSHGASSLTGRPAGGAQPRGVAPSEREVEAAPAASAEASLLIGGGLAATLLLGVAVLYFTRPLPPPANALRPAVSIARELDAVEAALAAGDFDIARDRARKARAVGQRVLEEDLRLDRLEPAIELAAGLDSAKRAFTKGNLAAAEERLAQVETQAPGDPGVRALRAAIAEKKAEPPPAPLALQSAPEGATVTIDGVAAGTTPLVGWSLKRGLHVVRLEKPGFATTEENVFGTGRPLTVLVTLEPESKQAPPPAK